MPQDHTPQDRGHGGPQDRRVSPRLSLARVLATPDTAGAVVAGFVAGINADGTVIVDFGGGRKTGACRVLATYTPVMGDVVECIRRDASSWLVLGAIRTSNATTQTLLLSVRMPYNVRPGVGGVSNPLVVNATATGSWRPSDGWSRAQPYQGAYSSSYGYWQSGYFYGAGAFAALAGRTVTSITIRLHRNTAIGGSGVGSSAATALWIAPHAHPTQPSGAPTWTDTAQNVGALTAPDDSQVGTFALPVAWGQALVNGSAAGFGHLRLTTTEYLRCKGVAEDALTGQLSIGWS